MKGDLKENSMDKAYMIGEIAQMQSSSDLNFIADKSSKLIEELSSWNVEEVTLEDRTGNSVTLTRKSLISQLSQIRDSMTLERSKYYLKRLEKGITKIKTGAINDININLWQDYDDIITDSLWIFNRRDNSGNHNAEYWGNFIPQIPNQFIRRYTKKDEWVLDPFMGSGTTLMECRRLGRNGVGIELSPHVADISRMNIEGELQSRGTRSDIYVGDSGNEDIISEIRKKSTDHVQLIIMHPPYWDIIKFSENSNDLSCAGSVENFLDMFGNIVDKTYDILDKGRYLVLVIGDKYSRGIWIPLGFYAMNEVMKRGYELKSIVVKNFNSTKGKRVQEDLWRYRALVGGFYVFKHEYVFLFRKSGRTVKNKKQST